MRNFATEYEATQYARTMGMSIACTIDGDALHHAYPDGSLFCDGAVCRCAARRAAALAAQVGAQMDREGCTVLVG